MDRDRDGGVRGMTRDGGGEAPGDPRTRPLRSGGERDRLGDRRLSPPWTRGGGERGEREYRAGTDRFGGGELQVGRKTHQ